MKAWRLIIKMGCADLDYVKLCRLGIESFEVACMKQGSPSIRLIHKLSDIPTDIATDPEE